MNDPRLKNIWLTSKTRMLAEVRYNNYNTIFNLLFSYYSLLLIITSIFTQPLSIKVPYFNEINVCLSIALFVFSLIIYGFGFEKIATSHRDCYLKLQKLLNESIPDIEKLNKYDDILSYFGNHKSKDYDQLVVFRSIFNGEKLENSKGQIEVTKYMIIRVLLHFLCFWLFTVMAFTIPVLTLVYPFLFQK